MCKRSILNKRIMLINGKLCIVDSCLVSQMKTLRSNIVTTLASCCGHGDFLPWCDIVAEDRDKAEGLGYEVVSEFRNRGDKFDILEIRMRSNDRTG